MSFSFKVEKPKNLRETLENVKKEVAKYKGSFVGNEKEGHISASGVKGTYVTADDAIELTITKKPFLLPEFAIKSFVVNTFKKCSA